MRPFSQRLPTAPTRLSESLRAQARERARRARRKAAALLPVLVGLFALERYRLALFGIDTPVRIGVAVVLVIVGWAFARQLGHALRPRLRSRLDPGTAGIAGFLIRLATMVVIVLVSARLAGVQLREIALGASATAIVFGLAAQQTFGNILAGVVLLSARSFSVGDRVRFNGFGMDVEGTVVSHGLLYVTMHDGDDLVLVPNNTALTMSVRPIREPAAVDMRARLPRTTDPEVVQERIQSGVSIPTRGAPDVALEEMDGEDVVLRIRATPADPAHGGPLAREVLASVNALSAAA